MTAAADTKALAGPQALVRVPVGLASPLWGLFAGAAISGAAWWWMTRWTRPHNLEAMFGAAAEAVLEPEAAALAAAEPVVEALGEAAPQPVAEAWAEASPEPVLQALVETSPAPEPVGGESAPISPVLEALAPQAAEPIATTVSLVEAAAEPAPAPKPKKKTAAAAKTA